MVRCNELKEYLGQLLQVDLFSDSCPNGLQIEGNTSIKKIVTGVTASHELISQAIALEADTLIVHHGFFWKNEAAPIIDIKYRRIKALLDHNINLFAYHLPLDAQGIFGNNALLCQYLGATSEARFGHQNVGFLATLTIPEKIEAFILRVEKEVGKKVIVAGPLESGKTISTIAVCSGGGQSFFQDAIQAGADLFLTGEISEHNVHEAKEWGVYYVAAGHHATERFGIRALGEHLAQHFCLDVTFIDIDSGV